MKKLLKSKPALIAIAVCVLLLGIGGASGSDNQELKDQLTQATEQLNASSSQNDELSQQIQDLTSTVDELTEKNEQLQDDLDSANAQIAELSSLENQQSVIGDLNSQIHGSKHFPQEIFCNRKTSVRSVDIHAVVFHIMAICMVTVNRKHRESADQLHTLPQYIGKFQVIFFLVIGTKRKNASCHSTHNICCRSLHNDIPCKVCRKIHAISQL